MFEKHKKHLKLVESDPEFIEAFNKLPNYSDETLEQYQNLAMEFAVYVEELMHMKHGYKMSDFSKPYVIVPSAEKDGTVAVFVDPKATKQEYLEAWVDVQKLRKSLGTESTKRKFGEKPELIYAIFRARRKGNTFTEIFHMYKERSLQNYDGPNKQFKDVEELTWYYSRRSPDKLYE